MKNKILDTNQEVQLLKNLLNDDSDFSSYRLLTIHYKNEYKYQNEDSINSQSKEEFNSILH